MYVDKERKKLNGVYKWAKARCNNPNVIQYKDWGGRGIKFRFQSFDQFMECLGPRPIGGMLDRINNDGHYEPGNVRWATRKQQNNNKRTYITNKIGIPGVSILTARGKYKSDRYIVRVQHNGERLVLYQGIDLFEAICAYKRYRFVYEK